MSIFPSMSPHFFIQKFFSKKVNCPFSEAPNYGCGKQLHRPRQAGGTAGSLSTLGTSVLRTRICCVSCAELNSFPLGLECHVGVEHLPNVCEVLSSILSTLSPIPNHKDNKS